MKRHVAILLFFLGIFQKGHGQAFDPEFSNIDSARRTANLMENTIKRDRLLSDLANYYNESKLDSGLYFAQQALQLSMLLNDKKGEADAYGALCYIYKGYGDYAKALDYGLKGLRIFESLGDPQELAACNNRLGHISLYQNNLNDAIAYYSRAIRLDDEIHNPSVRDSYKAIHLSNLSFTLFRLNLLDSALIVAERANDLFRRVGTNPKYAGTGLVRMAMIYQKMGQNVLASELCKQGIRKSIESNNIDNVADGYLEMAAILFSEGRSDSALRSAKIGFTLYTQLNMKFGIVDGSLLLSKLYKQKGEIDSAFFYQGDAINTKDSIFTEANISRLNNMSFEEKLFQRQMIEEANERQLKQERNLQFVGVFIAVIVVLILFIVLSRTIIVGEKFIEYSGALAFLALFEFSNLLIHTFFGEIDR